MLRFYLNYLYVLQFLILPSILYTVLTFAQIFTQYRVNCHAKYVRIVMNISRTTLNVYITEQAVPM